MEKQLLKSTAWWKAGVIAGAVALTILLVYSICYSAGLFGLQRGTLGLSRGVSTEFGSAWHPVTKVAPGSPAMEAGILPGDKVRLNDPVRNLLWRPGERTTLLVATRWPSAAA